MVHRRTDTSRYGKRHYECRRCELNAFSSDQLAEFIEIGLQRHGATTKLVPPADVLVPHVEEVRDGALTHLIARELEHMVDVDVVVHQLVTDYPDLVDVDEARIRDTFTDNPIQSWRSSAEQLVAEDIDAIDGISDAVRALLVQLLVASMNDDNETDERP